MHEKYSSYVIPVDHDMHQLIKDAKLFFFLVADVLVKMND